MSAIFPPPIGNVRDGSAFAAAIAIKGRIRTFGPHLVMCDSWGRVFVRPEDDKRAVLMASRFPHMVVGVFNEDAASADIAEAVVFVHDELAGVVA